MAEYIEVAEAIDKPGLRLVLTAGFPGPWGEAAKGILHVKGIPYLKVRQRAAMANEELRRWTGRANAPIAIYDDEPARDGWAEILYLAERLAPQPALIPSNPEQRVRMFGLARELCGEDGFGWLRRLDIMARTLNAAPADAPDAVLEGPGRLAARYGFSVEALEKAPARLREILGLLSRQLERQRQRGSLYFIGDALSALDIYWATFAALFEPLADEQCPLPGPMRSMYTLSDPELRACAAPILLEHRDLIYREHLQLPLDF